MMSIISFEFDESPTVVSAISNVGMEGLIGTVLTGLMVLLFLRDWRSVIVVVLNIPLALLGSLFALWITGYTINIMTLGGIGPGDWHFGGRGHGVDRKHPRSDDSHQFVGSCGRTRQP